jgi:hypothetical protein
MVGVVVVADAAIDGTSHSGIIVPKITRLGM